MLRFFSDEKKNKNKKALDIGCGAGRHSKLLLDMGFKVEAIDIDPQNVNDTRELLKNYEKDRYSLECKDFLDMDIIEEYDLVIAWSFLYAFNNELSDCPEKICKIRDMLCPGGKIVMSLKSDEDSWKRDGIQRENGIVDNVVYNNPGYVFYSQKDMVEMITKCGLHIEYIEKFSRAHTLEWRNISTNDIWEKKALEVSEVYYALCVTKV